MTLIIFEASRDVNGIESVVLIDESQIRSSKELNLHAAVSIDVQVVQPVYTIGSQYSGNDRSRHFQGWFELQRAPVVIYRLTVNDDFIETMDQRQAKEQRRCLVLIIVVFMSRCETGR